MIARDGWPAAGPAHRPAGRGRRTPRRRSAASPTARTCCRSTPTPRGWSRGASPAAGRARRAAAGRPARRSWTSAACGAPRAPRAARAAARCARAARPPTPGSPSRVTPRRRPQGRYEGSMRQRRGDLLRALAATGAGSARARDPEAAPEPAGRRPGRAPRRAAGAGGVGRVRGPQQVVVAAVIERGGRILVSQRGPGGGQPGRWEFPGGKREPRRARRRGPRARDPRGAGRRDRGGRARVDRARRAARAALLPPARWLPGQRPRPLGSVQFRWVRARGPAGAQRSRPRTPGS